ncbi:hypothetical protein AVEN_171976-1 [Araneus ventricosus]|uniref:Uncharacterized protein n=1 Tax=Araneus ventricosus TaxID=182803 RepID=A0A4Y2J1X6_ARAVE|nr:hypothetical protein AVEN_171976-1 [Araneus ventricosus]
MTSTTLNPAPAFPAFRTTSTVGLLSLDVRFKVNQVRIDSRSWMESGEDLTTRPPRHLKGSLNAFHTSYGLIHHPWLNPDQRLKGNLPEQANADRNNRLDVSPNWRVGEKLVWLEG